MKKCMLLLTIAGFLSFHANAQVPVSAANADNPITSGNSTYAQNVNCDMIYYVGGGHLRAVAYDDYDLNISYVYLEDDAGASTLLTIPNAVDIDIVLGDDMSNAGNDYILLAVYNNGTNAMLESFSIIGAGLGSLTVNPLSATFLPVMSTGQSRNAPHIDMCPDPSIMIGGLPSLHGFAVTWTEQTAGGFSDAYLSTGDNASVGAFGTTYPITSDGRWADVACLWDRTTNEPYAYVVYTNISGNLDLWEVNLATTANSVIAPALNAGMGVLRHGRIEAMGVYDASIGRQRYEVAYGADAGFGYTDMISYNDLAGNINLTAGGTGLNLGNNMFPAIAAGPGIVISDGFNNDNHTVCWYNEANMFFYAQAIETSSGIVNTTYPDYYEVNQNQTSYMALPPEYNAPIGVSSSSNLGHEALLTAWNNDNDIFFKFQNNVSQYKPTSVPTAAMASYRLYPNPAAHTVTIESKNQAIYTLTDITGRTLLQGKLAQGRNTITVEGLAKGMYLISVTDNGTTTALKFTKD